MEFLLVLRGDALEIVAVRGVKDLQSVAIARIRLN
jgi:hypothetical protein